MLGNKGKIKRLEVQVDGLRQELDLITLTYKEKGKLLQIILAIIKRLESRVEVLEKEREEQGS